MVFRSPVIPALLTLLCVAVPGSVTAADRFTVTPTLTAPERGPRGAFPHGEVRRPRIGLVLSGGGARGITQIGVLRALERHGIPVDLVAATSLGAIVGGLYAAGYTPDELERLAVTTDWDEVLSLTEEDERTDLLMDEKLADDRSFVALRFQGLDPVFPSAVSSGQRLTTFLNEKTLQALYHPKPRFDDLRIPFRAVATDLVSGARVILGEGSLAEALRAASTVPLLFNPIERDSMLLLDGGLVSNIPADVARAAGADIVVVVNSTSGLRPESDLDAPWKTADQIMGIMMQLSNRQQIDLADVVITPEIGDHLSSDFTGIDSLIARGERAGEEAVGKISALYAERERAMVRHYWGETPGLPPVDFRLTGLTVRAGDAITGDLRRKLEEPNVTGWMEAGDLGIAVNAIAATCRYRSVSAEVSTDGTFWEVTYRAEPNPVLYAVRFEGNGILSAGELGAAFDTLAGRPINHFSVERALEEVLRCYRVRGLSLARIEHTAFDQASGVLTIGINEGVIDHLSVEGGVRTRDDFVLGEFPLAVGEVFEIGKANTGITNLNGTRLFEFVYLEPSYPGDDSRLTIRLKERPSQLLRLGIRIDNERNLQGSLDIRDENFRGSGGQLGLTGMGGARNKEIQLEYKAGRVFGGGLSLGISTFARVIETYLYGDVPQASANTWDRERIGEYRDIRYGAGMTLSGQLERLGAVSAQYTVQRARIKNIENAEPLEDGFLLALLRVGTVLDTKDSYPFPASGIGLSMSYEIAARALGSDVSYNALRLELEEYSSWGGGHTFHPRITVGFADRAMPLGQQFRFGGREVFFGLHEDDRRGRQMLLANIEYRWRLPFRILFDTYLRFRYDLGSISRDPGEIKLSTFRHGLGAELALDSPVGPVVVAVGRSFHFVRDLPENPLQTGPWLFYFLVGYQL